MGLRFQKRIRLFKGLTLNLSKSGGSLTLGGPGASVNVGRKRVTGNVGIPGTGVSYRETLAGGRSSMGPGRLALWIVALLVLAYLHQHGFRL